jgi:hypothetical protein
MYWYDLVSLMCANNANTLLDNDVFCASIILSVSCVFLLILSTPNNC